MEQICKFCRKFSGEKRPHIKMKKNGWCMRLRRNVSMYGSCELWKEDAKPVIK